MNCLQEKREGSRKCQGRMSRDMGPYFSILWKWFEQPNIFKFCCKCKSFLTVQAVCVHLTVLFPLKEIGGWNQELIVVVYVDGNNMWSKHQQAALLWFLHHFSNQNNKYWSITFSAVSYHVLNFSMILAGSIDSDWETWGKWQISLKCWLNLALTFFQNWVFWWTKPHSFAKVSLQIRSM